MKSTDDENEAVKRRRDLDDYQNELVGAETGRMRRFFTNEEQTPEGRRKKRDAEIAQSQLDLMLQDPAYRAKFTQTMDALRQAEHRTETALSRIEQTIHEEKQALQDMRDRAARLPDGTLVFQDRNGTVRRADGRVVEDHLAETILWTGNEPEFKAYQAQIQKLENLDHSQREVIKYRDEVLGPARDRMSDEDNPPSVEEMDEIMQGITEQMPDSVQDFAPMDGVSTAPEMDPRQIAMPDITTKP